MKANILLRLSLCISLFLFLLLHLECFVEATSSTTTKEEPIIVGEASYYPPTPEYYGERVGIVLLDFHNRKLQTKHNQKASIELVEWYQSLGQAHFDDAIDGVVYDSFTHRQTSRHASLPKKYHLELSLHAYELASKTLFEMLPENELLQIHPIQHDNMRNLQLYATIEYTKGGVLSSMASEESLTDSSSLYSLAVDSYRKSKNVFETLRYSSIAKRTSLQDEGLSDRIDAYYANSCLELGNLLYSQLILAENEKVAKYNEQLTGAMKAQIGDDLDIVAELMDQANGGKGLGGNTAGIETLEALQGSLLGELGTDTEAWNAAIQEVTELLDTAILTYHQHANLQRTQKDNASKEVPMKVIVNGVVRKSLQDLMEEERLFPWRVSLAMAYQEAATVATTRNQKVRARELMRLALQVYTEDILPYYQEQSLRQKRLARLDGSFSQQQIPNTQSFSAITEEFAKQATGTLYKTLATTDFYLGSYKDSQAFYAKCMEWYATNHLDPEPDEKFDIFYGDEAGRSEYQDFVSALETEMEQYRNDVKARYVYQDDNYEGNLLLSMVPVYLAMGDAKASIRCCQQAIAVYERSTHKDPSDTLALLNLADARFGLANAYFHEKRYSESQEEHSLACLLYQQVYGEGKPPKTADVAALEEMKDEIIQTYGQDYFDQLQSYYDGKGTERSNTKPQIAIDLDFFPDNETDAGGEHEYEEPFGEL